MGSVELEGVGPSSRFYKNRVTTVERQLQKVDSQISQYVYGYKNYIRLEW